MRLKYNTYAMVVIKRVGPMRKIKNARTRVHVSRDESAKAVREDWLSPVK